MAHAIFVLKSNGSVFSYQLINFYETRYKSDDVDVIIVSIYSCKFNLKFKLQLLKKPDVSILVTLIDDFWNAAVPRLL